MFLSSFSNDSVVVLMKFFENDALSLGIHKLACRVDHFKESFIGREAYYIPAMEWSWIKG